MEEFLSRVDIPCSLSDFVDQIASVYKLGNVVKWEPIKEGYVELNIKTTTEKGVYVIKIFSKDKPYTNIRDNIKGLVEFSKAGIPVTKLLKYNKGFLYKAKPFTYACVMEFFDGKNFEKIRPSETDLKTITKYLAKTHHLRFKVNRNYDPWGTVNLIKEFLDKKDCLTRPDLKLIELIVSEFRKIDFSKLRRTIIHGDLQRKHVLKNKEGEYCILDLGFMDFNAAVVDLAIFIALFCFDVNSSAKYNRKVYSMVVKEYTKTNPLNVDEIQFLPLLIRATYAIYTIGSSYLFFPKNDKSVQTKKWLSFGRKGLKLFEKFN